MKGFVPTPPHIVDDMVGRLFGKRPPKAGDILLDPGCGTGAFIQGVVRWCELNGCACPKMVGIESDPVLYDEAKRNLGQLDSVTLLLEDFLAPRRGGFDFVIGNPPYVPITGLTESDRATYRRMYRTATGRFDLYLLFFEQALKLLKPKGRLVFITPEKFLYVQTAGPLRKQLAGFEVEDIELISETAFGELVTYPTITTVRHGPADITTEIRLRDGATRSVRLTDSGASWLPLVNGNVSNGSKHVLADAFVRISCGVATGADSVFVVKTSEISPSLEPFAYPTLSGREITIGQGIRTAHSMLVPYAKSGALLPERELGALGIYLRESERQSRLLKRTCVARKPWYAFHENPPLVDILRPKILCKDIGSRPYFVADEDGTILPRHSVYYLVPKDDLGLDELCAYLNSGDVQEWLMDHCQRAANGFVRLQSHVIKRIPLPEHLLRIPQTHCL